MACSENQWILKHNDFRWAFYTTEFLYKYHDKINGWGNWRQLYSSYPVLTAESFYDSLEFNIICKDYWIDYADTIIKIIPITEGGACHNEAHCLSEPIPNPVNSQFYIEFNLYNNSSVKLALYDFMGGIIMDIAQGDFKKGNYHYDIKTEELSEGMYFVILKTEMESYIKKVVVYRY